MERLGHVIQLSIHKFHFSLAVTMCDTEVWDSVADKDPGLFALRLSPLSFFFSFFSLFSDFYISEKSLSLSNITNKPTPPGKAHLNPCLLPLCSTAIPVTRCAYATT